jgi:phosphinothricin acetyltransferase
MLVMRNATIDDLKSITKIYNDAIKNTVATFDTEIKTIKEQTKWFSDHGKKNPILVAEENGSVIGWAALSKYSTRCAYSDTAEISLYVKEENQGKGIGKKLMESIIKEGKNAGLHVIIARITDGNKKSIHIHESVGFSHIGIMKEVGYKFGKLLDVYLMQKIYNDKY